jgi:hypothetical protein
MQTKVRNLFKELDLVKDFKRRNITPGSVRKSGRMSAKLAGKYDDPLLDAIRGWKQKSLPKEFYEDFMVPKETTNVILWVNVFMRMWREKKVAHTGRPNFDEEDLIVLERLSKETLDDLEEEEQDDESGDDE